MKNFTKQLIAIAFTALLSNSVFSQTIRNYNLSEFQKINMGSALIINVSQGDHFKVISKGRKEDMDKLDVYVRNNTLNVENKSKWKLWNYNDSKKIEFLIVMPTLAAVNFSGASNSLVTGFDDLNTLNIELSGASKSKIDIFTKTLEVELSGASNLKLIGRANKLDASLSGASEIEATNFPVQSANIDASGASNIKLNASNTIDVEASGAANIKYLGNAKVHKNTSGGANVSRLK